MDEHSVTFPDRVSRILRARKIPHIAALTFLGAIVAHRIVGPEHTTLRQALEVVIISGLLSFLLSLSSRMNQIQSLLPSTTLSARMAELCPMMRSIAEHRYRRVDASVAEMAAGNFVQNVVLPAADLGVTFSAILESVRSRFETVSVSQFWTSGNMGGAALEDYAIRNYECARRGATVRRYLIVDDTAHLRGWVRRAAVALLEREEQLAQDSTKGKGKLELYLIPRADLGEWDQRSNFAIWDDVNGDDWHVEMTHEEGEDGGQVFSRLQIGKGASQAMVHQLKRCNALTSASQYRATFKAYHLRKSKTRSQWLHHPRATMHNGPTTLDVELWDYDKDPDGTRSFGFGVGLKLDGERRGAAPVPVGATVTLSMDGKALSHPDVRRVTAGKCRVCWARSDDRGRWRVGLAPA